MSGERENERQTERKDKEVKVRERTEQRHGKKVCKEKERRQGTRDERGTREGLDR